MRDFWIAVEFCATALGVLVMVWWVVVFGWGALSCLAVCRIAELLRMGGREWAMAVGPLVTAGSLYVVSRAARRLGEKG